MGKGIVGKIEASFVSLVDAIFFSSLLAPYAQNPTVETVYYALIENAMMGVVVLSAVLTLILTTVIFPKTMEAKKAVEKEATKAKVGAAKKKEAPTKDDDEKDDEDEDEDEDASPTRRSRRTTRRD